MASHLEEKRVSAKRVILTSFGVDLLDILLNLVIAYFSGSVVMLSQVLEAVADLVSSGFLWVGLHRSRKREDKMHPFGYGREIYFWTLLSALIMFGITATFSFYFGIQRVIHPEPIHEINIALVVLFITIVTNGYAFFLSFQRLLKKRNPKHIMQIFYRSSLVETKTTFILDLMGTIASILGMVALAMYQVTADSRYDGVGAIVIALVLAILTYFLLIGIRDLLIGRSASPEVEAKIKEAILSIPHVKDVLDLKTLHIGTERLLVNVEVYLHSHLTTREIELLMDDIKAKVQLEVPSVKHIQVELETPVR